MQKQRTNEPHKSEGRKAILEKFRYEPVIIHLLVCYILRISIHVPLKFGFLKLIFVNACRKQ